jgi:acyl-CoA dehydrogenase
VVDFTLTDEQKNLREMAHDFAEGEIRPVAWEYDKDATWPEELLKKAWEVGLMNTHVPEEYGGPEASYTDSVLIEEELGWGCGGIATSCAANGLASAPLMIAASDELKREYLGRLTEAPLLASYAITEPDAGSDVSAMRTTAVRKGDKWVINGSKCFITNGSHANWYTVFAKTDKEAGHRGISAFVIPRDAGVVVDKKEDKLGQRASDTATISFNDVEIPADHLIGGVEGQGFYQSTGGLELGRINVAARGVGIAEGALRLATEYAQVRKTFGKPSCEHQAIQLKLGDMATRARAARLLPQVGDQALGRSLRLRPPRCVHARRSCCPHPGNPTSTETWAATAPAGPTVTVWSRTSAGVY